MTVKSTIKSKEYRIPITIQVPVSILEKIDQEVEKRKISRTGVFDMAIKQLFDALEMPVKKSA